jgi:hypothetical protein
MHADPTIWMICKGWPEGAHETVRLTNLDFSEEKYGLFSHVGSIIISGEDRAIRSHLFSKI